MRDSGGSRRSEGAISPPNNNIKCPIHIPPHTLNTLASQKEDGSLAGTSFGGGGICPSLDFEK